MPTDSALSAQFVDFQQIVQSQNGSRLLLRDHTAEPAQLRSSRTNYTFGECRHHGTFSRRRVRSEERRTDRELRNKAKHALASR
jgi:hypothetical protein